MFRTIKSKIIMTVLLLILSIQVVAAIIQYVRVRSVFFTEFISGAQGLAQVPYIDLSSRLESTLIYLEKDSDNKNADAENIATIDLFISIIQPALFGEILNFRDDLLEIKFVNKNGKVVVLSYKKDQEVVHYNESEKKDMAISEAVSAMVNEKKLHAIEEDGRFNIFVPFTIKDLSYGGLVLVYSDKKIIEERNKIVLFMALSTFFAIVIFIPITWFVSSRIIQPIQGIVGRFKDIAEGEGDLTARLDASKNDETGELSKWFNIFMEKMQALIQEIIKNANTLNVSAGNLSSLSNHMSQSADKMSEKTNTVAAASEEMSTNVNSVSSAMEQASTNVSLVAAAIEEMTSTINEIAQNSENGRAISNDAVVKVKSASDRVGELGKDALEINKVTETITEISEQTNLLALNATIEAARAGESGKGFAVVANEIKELARQTADATLEIKAKIESIQNSTAGTVKEFEQITKVIHQVNEIVSSIAASVEEQSATAREVASNINQISSGIQEVNQNVAQSSMVAGDIAKDIAETNQGIDEISNSSSQLNASAEELSRLAEKLTQMVGRFKA
ncbi:MAG: HAMP domain-containing protein [Deltaproteobacteria bacterium]|nr:HAMP domain-containing protein [Deltaproteobacteria bacterium]